MRICSCPYNHYVVNFSLTSGQFHPIMKESIISPLPTKSAWDKDELSNYRSISNLSIISKTTERVVNNTQLFFSSHPLNFDSSISHPENALQQISSRITSNFLTINSFKTEFLLIWLKNNLLRYIHVIPLLAPPTLLAISALFLTNTWPLARLHLSPNFAAITIQTIWFWSHSNLAS